MWITEATHTTAASRENIWKLWTDVGNWQQWDKDVEHSELFGAFQVGTEGTLKPVGGPKTAFEITECTQQTSFTDRSFLPLCTIDFVHTMKQTPQGIEITHKVVMQGLMTFVFSKIIGKNIERGFPRAVQTLAKLAETM
jgi:hypothetical protein